MLKSIAYKHKDMPVCFLEVLSQILVINDKVFRCQIDRFFSMQFLLFFYLFFGDVSCKTFFFFLNK